MTKTMLAAALGALLLSGCSAAREPGANAAPEENPVNAMTGGNDAAAVVGMNDGTRRLTFARALIKADLPCDGVVKAESVGEQNGLPMWRATCKNGTAYAMSVTPDGTVNILARPAGR